ncbi:lantibiotic dehydratase family protein [Chryseobacterium sp. WLY505]|uniref:lantibiotic dehydratase family protein n=1 Tax=Chryseobacterium sp. WLY505 TaxID=3068892 RepID=UPI0027963E20|nr:lantibiotic dehydratase family protein [Chryseobacterium sp. WLY505]MDQ1858284.1 lantibiotic dehydratase family protein [Chryseobacterium sp. WLY505]
MPRFPFQFFDTFVVRSPIFSYKEFQDNFSGENITKGSLEKYCNHTIFREAIYLASLSLYDEIEKLTDRDHTTSYLPNEKTKISLLKYYNRTSTRSTPFGLFSGVSIGRFEKENTFPVFSEGVKIRDTKLDMHFLVALSEQLIFIPHIKNSLLFFPNNSIHQVGSKIRYMEYENNNGKRDYVVSSAPLSKELEHIIHFCKAGKTIDQIASVLIDEEISLEEAKEFIDELIENQVLISELNPTVSGDDFLELIISVLKRIGAHDEKEILSAIKSKINELDLHFGNTAEAYSEIEALIKKLNVQYEKKYLFQTDLYFASETDLSYQWKKGLKKGISFLNKIADPHKETALEKFKKAFHERFEHEEVPLSYALDPEIGIGYLQNIPAKGVHPYIEDLILPYSRQQKEIHIKLNPLQVILNQKLQKALWNKDAVIHLTDQDFNGFEEDWKNVPDTLSVMAEIVSEGQQEKLLLKSISGNAGKLLGRFCSEKSSIKDLVKTIAEKEQELNMDKILAEILHLPESRIGNVIRRPSIRAYEIPYLASSALKTENQLPIDDLYLSIRNNQLFLRSKKYNKEVIPHLTNAHNYSHNSLPIYHFLCDYNNQNVKPYLSFSWGGLSQIYECLPRVEYQNIILSKAQWKIDSEQIHYFDSILQSGQKDLLFQKIEEWRQLKRIPQWIQWVKGDNTLAINLKNYDLIQIFLSSVKNEKTIFIEEFLCNDQSDYIHQFVFSLYKDL